MNSQFALPGIKSLAYVFSDNLNNNIAMQAVAKMPIMIFAQLTPLPFTGECTCVVENTNENNGTAETATLTFQSQVAGEPSGRIRHYRCYGSHLHPWC